MKYLRLILLFSSISLSQIKFISPNGSDLNGDGSFDNPYLTIQSGINNGGAEILLLEGIYTIQEQINGSDLIIRPYLDDNVVYNGTITINDPDNLTADWEIHSKNIYRTQIDQPIWQLFVDDQEMIMARWPNSSFDNESIYKKEY